jgi:cytochrome P450
MLPAMLQTALMWSRPLQCLAYCRKRYGSVFTLRMIGHPPLIFVSDPDDLRAVLGADEQLLRPGDGGAAVAPIVGESSFMLQHGLSHRSARKALSPSLRATAVEQHAAMVRAVAERAVAAWPTGRPIRLHQRLRGLTLEVILRLLASEPEGPLDRRLQELQRRILAMLSITSSPLVTESYLRRGPGKTKWKRFLRDRSAVDELLFELIRERSAAPAGLMAGILSIPNLDGAPTTLRQIRDNLMSIILAGHETTAAQLAWAFQLLAHDQEAQAQLAEATDDSEGARQVSAAIQEILRHRCVFLFAIPRTLTSTIEIAGHTCEPPAQLLPCIALIHHDPDAHPAPSNFMPSRYLHDAPDPNTWIPWGGGARRCPGAHLATTEISAVLRAALGSRTIAPAGKKIERPRWRSVIVAPHDGCRVILSRRQRST